MNISKTIVTLSLIASVALCNVNQDNQELVSFTAQKHRVDFNAQTQKSKSDITAEYTKISKIYDAITPSIKDDVDIKVAMKMLSIDIWANKYMVSINPSDDEIKKVYEAQSPKVSAKYNLRNILVSDEKEADKLLKAITSNKDKTKKLSQFKQFAKEHSIDLNTKNKEGQIGFVDSNKLDKLIQEALKDKKADDIVKLNIANIGTQLIYVEEYQSERKASIEEAKSILISIIRQERLKTKIDEMIVSPK